MSILLFLIGLLTFALIGFYAVCGLWFLLTVKLIGNIFGKKEKKMTYDEWLNEHLMDSSKR